MLGTVLPFLLLGAAIGGAVAFRRKGRRAGFVLMSITAVLSVVLCILAVMIALKKSNLI
jgi:succinate dehydrogenase hydrophobic anchor subunit